MPEWKLKSLARNMGVVFVGEGNDAALPCSDPAFSHFVVTGSLIPKPTTKRTPSILVSRPSSSSNGGGHPQLPEERAVILGGSTATTVSKTAPGNQLETANNAFRAEEETSNQLQTANNTAFRATETGAVLAVGGQSQEHGGRPIIARSCLLYTSPSPRD